MPSVCSHEALYRRAKVMWRAAVAADRDVALAQL
jgi:hypothetical protein